MPNSISAKVTLGRRPLSHLAKDVEILVDQADLAAQGSEGVSEEDARLRLDRSDQNHSDFRLGAAPMLSGSHPQCAVHVVGQIAYC